MGDQMTMKLIKACLQVIILSLLLTACFPSGAPAPTAPPTPVVTSIQIDRPADGARVDQKETIKGQSQNLPPNTLIWIVIYLPSVERYYPQNHAANRQVDDGEWTATVSIGQDGETGLQADIIVVLADDNVQGIFNEYLEDARDKNDYPGLEMLPPDIEYDRVSVIRK
jgi:hypothetical protein